jgi:hypothetical protein
MNESTRAFYLLPSRFWELASGALLFQLHWHNVAVPRNVVSRNAAVLTGLLAIVVSMRVSSGVPFPFPGACLPVGGALLIIAGVSRTSTAGAQTATYLRKSVVVGLGRLSYSLYLWHWPVYTLFRWTVGLDGAVKVAGAVAITLASASLSYRFLESPIRQSGLVRRQSRKAIVCAGLLAVGLGSAIAASIFEAQPRLSLSVTREAATWNPSERYQAAQMPATCRSADRQQRVGNLFVDIFERVGCNSARSSNVPRLFVAGDSHAGAYTRMLRRYADEHGVVVWLYSAGGCSIASLIRPSESTPPECAQLVRTALAEIAQNAKAGDLVFLTSLRMERLGDEWAFSDVTQRMFEQDSPNAKAGREQAYVEADELLTSLEKRNLRILIDAPTPVFMSPPFRCSDWFNSRNPICSQGLTVSLAFLLVDREPVMTALRKLQQQHPDLIVWDPFPLLCPVDPCSAFDGSKPLFGDGDHLSGHGNDVLYPQFEALLATRWATD